MLWGANCAPRWHLSLIIVTKLADAQVEQEPAINTMISACYLGTAGAVYERKWRIHYKIKNVKK